MTSQEEANFEKKAEQVQTEFEALNARRKEYAEKRAELDRAIAAIEAEKQIKKGEFKHGTGWV